MTGPIRDKVRGARAPTNVEVSPGSYALLAQESWSIR
jgi:hypothetical protein